MPRSSARALFGRKKQTGRGDLGGPGLPHQTPQTTDFPGDNIEICSEILQKFSYLVYDNEMLGIFSPLIIGVNYRLANLEGF